MYVLSDWSYHPISQESKGRWFNNLPEAHRDLLASAFLGAEIKGFKYFFKNYFYC